MPNTAPFPYVLQQGFISINLEGKSYPISKHQPVFKQVKRALERKQWGRIPKLLSLASQIAESTHGKIRVKADGVYYKDIKVENVITAKIMELIDHGKKVAKLLKFMDNLYRNPNLNTANEIYQWLDSKFTLTDDGCFLAYKKTDVDYQDFYTHTIDYHVGQVVVMPRKDVDPNRCNVCSYGLHFCSKKYLSSYGGSFIDGQCRIMEVKINPADVVSIPIDYNFTKGRTWRLEVMREVQPGEMIEGVTDTAVMMQPVVEFAKERKSLIKQLKSLPSVKRLIKTGKLNDQSFSKASTQRLIHWLDRFSHMDIAPKMPKLFENPLRFAREASGFTIGQVARSSGMALKDVYNAERAQNPAQTVIDAVLGAISKAQGSTVADAGASYPRPSLRRSSPLVKEEEEKDHWPWD